MPKADKFMTLEAYFLVEKADNNTLQSAEEKMELVR